MTIISLIPLLITLTIIIAIIKTKGKIRKICITLLAVIVLIPVSLVLLAPYMQKGKFFPTIGKISFLFSEPKDLWNPLGSAILDKNKKEYYFTVLHKYIGNHHIEILFSNNNVDPWDINRMDKLGIAVSFHNEQKELLAKKASCLGGFTGPRGNGLTCITYTLPEDLPINKDLIVKLEITGDIEKFISKYGNAKIIIKKSSDL